VAAPWLARLATVFARWAGGNAWAPLAVVLGLGCHVKLGFSILYLRISKNTFLLSAFFFILCIFHLFFGIDLQNILSRNTSGTWSIVNAYVS